MTFHALRTTLCTAVGFLICLVAPSARADDVLAMQRDAPSISLELRGADVRDALRMVAQQCDVDIVLGNEVAGAITLELAEANLKEALDAIMSVSGLLYQTDGAIITVTSMDKMIEQRRLNDELAGPLSAPGFLETPTQVRMFKLDYIDADRVLPLVQSLLSDVGKASILQTSDHVGQSSTSATGGVVADLQIGGRLSSSSQGQPAKSHTLVVVDVPDRIAEIAQVVEGIDVQPTQVLIEARFVEVSLGKDDKLGIDWNVVARGVGGKSPTTFPFGDSKLGSFNPNVAGGSSGGVFPPAPNSVSIPGEPGLFTFGALDFTALTAVLEMIQDDSRVSVVSNPHITVRDRNTATILVGERYPILSLTVSDQGTVTEELERYEPIGVQLEVTPSVLEGDAVQLTVRPSTSTLGPTVQGSTGIEVVRINTRQIDTTVTAQDGETVVLGGLISSRSVEVESRVPFLSSIPLLGKLFTHTSNESERVDLVVFLTVKVLRDLRLSERQRVLFERTSFDRDGDGESWWRRLEFIIDEPKD